MATKTESTAWDFQQVREDAPSHVRVFEWDGFFPVQQAPAFENCCTNNRCHKCK